MKPANDNTRNTSPLMTGMSRGDVWFGTVLTLSAALAIVLGLLITDAPWMVRKRQADQIRVNALMAMNNDIPRFAAEKGALPHNLTELNQFAKAAGDGLPQTDLVTGAPYEYVRVTDHIYRLCAVFDLATQDDARSVFRSWIHQAGHHCFEFSTPVIVVPGAPLPTAPLNLTPTAPPVTNDGKTF